MINVNVTWKASERNIEKNNTKTLKNTLNKYILPIAYIFVRTSTGKDKTIKNSERTKKQRTTNNDSDEENGEDAQRNEISRKEDETENELEIDFSFSFY